MTRVFKGFKNFKSLDYVTSWFWKGSQYISSSNAKLALVSTSSIVQGSQVSVLFPYIFKLDININFAYQAFPWRNNAKHNAGVHVVIIGLSAKTNRLKKIYKFIDNIWHCESVNNISPYLIKGNDLVIESRRSPFYDDLQPMIQGSKATDFGNFFLSPNEKDELLLIEPNSEKWLRKTIGSEEFINNKERWCLWLNDITEDELNELPEIKRRVEDVRENRLASKKLATQKLAATPHKFDEIKQPSDSSYIVAPIVSSERRNYIPMGILSSEIIATNLVQIIPNGTMYEFSILNSAAHNDWMRTVSSRLENRYRYLNTIVYNTFPFPDATDEQKKNIENLAEEILLARASNAGMTLAELYDPDKMPEDLKLAHSTLDDAVDKLYRPQGFTNTEERLAHLLARYEQLIEAEQQSKAKKKSK